MLNSVYFEENWSDRNVNFVLLKQMVIWQKFYSPYLSAIKKSLQKRAFFVEESRIGSLGTLGYLGLSTKNNLGNCFFVRRRQIGYLVRGVATTRRRLAIRVPEAKQEESLSLRHKKACESGLFFVEESRSQKPIGFNFNPIS